MQENILVVEDEKNQRDLVVQILQETGYKVAESGTYDEAVNALSTSQFSLILSDWKLPSMSGMDLLLHVRDEYPNTAFIMATAYGSIDGAVEAIQKGANNYLAKPYQRQTLLFTIQKSLEERRLRLRNQSLEEQLLEQSELVNLVGHSPSMQRIFKRIRKLASTQATILITGESGTGKELAARALHETSTRSGESIISVNCAALPENLVEAELFGAEKGAFTGAHKQQIGKCESAHKGTLFLDEIGELPLASQGKLLRLLQEGVINRLGGHKEIHLDVRVVAATNKDLEQEVKKGSFREDLYYRLNVIPIHMPPLRERRDDIPLLITHLLKKHSKQHGLSNVEMSASARAYLLNHPLPGNVRQLSNMVERMVVLSDRGVASLDGVEGPEDIPAPPNSAFTLPAEGINWEEHERSCLKQALEYANQNRAQAARLLGLNYKAFLYRLEKHKLS